VQMKDGRIVSDHRLDDPLQEDLRTLAQSKLGQAILGHNALDAYMNAELQQALHELLERVENG
jgi:hypothetical protein